MFDLLVKTFTKASAYHSIQWLAEKLIVLLPEIRLCGKDKTVDDPNFIGQIMV